MRYATTINDHTYVIEINRDGEITIDGETVTVPINHVYTKAQAQAYVNSIQAMINVAP